MPDPDSWVAAGASLPGRARELATIAARWRAAATEGLQVVRVAGEPGIGKSALLGAVTGAVIGDGGRVVRSRGDNAAPPLNPIARVVRVLAEGQAPAAIVEGLRFDADAILSLAPELRDGADQAVPARVVHLDIHRVADGIRRLLSWQAAERPIAILIDDAASLDVASRAVLRNLVADRPVVQTLLVVAEREEPEDEPSLGDDSWATVVRLLGLAADDLAAVINREAAFSPGRALIDELAAATGGNPGFALEVVREGDPARLTQGVATVVSPAAEALARRRVHRLSRLPGPDGIDHRLRVAAVLDDDVDLEVLEAVTGEAGSDLAGVLGRAEGARVLERRSGSGFRFTAGARAVLADGVGPGEGADLHAQAARFLADRAGPGSGAGDERPGELAARIATHMLAAAVAPGGPGADAVDWVCRAADATSRAGDPGASVRLLRRAHELLATAPAEQRAQVGIRLGFAVWATDGARPARQVFATAAAAARAAVGAARVDAAVAAELLAEAAVGYARTVDRAGPPDTTALWLLDDALEALVGASSPPLARAAAESCRALLTNSADPRRDELVAAALHGTGTTGPSEAAALAQLALHAATWGPASCSERLAAADAAMAAAARSSDIPLALEARRLRHADLLIAGDRPAADAEFAAFLARAERYPHAGTDWHVAALRAARAQMDGRLESASTRATEAKAAAAATDPAPARAVAVALALAQPPSDEHPWHGLLAEIDDLLDLRPEAALWHAARARVLVEQGMTEEARSVITRFLVDQPGRIPVDADWLPTIALLAASVVALGDAAGAESLERVLAPWAGRIIVWSPWAVTWGSVDSIRGELAAVAGRGDDAIEHLVRAIALETAFGAPAFVARTRAHLADLRAATARDGGEAPEVEPAAAVPTATPPSPVPVPAPSATAIPSPEAPSPAGTSTVRCFGQFALDVGGQRIDLSGLTPRLRSLAWFLAVNADEVVHAERVVDALWPESDVTAGRRNLQVAVSALRQVVEPGARRGGWVVIAREGEGYRLSLGGGSSDLRAFELAAARARRERDPAGAEAALALYGGDLIPEAGPVTWLVERRDACRRAAADVALLLAECRLAEGDPAAAVAACETGLAIDRYLDGLWRTLVEAAEAKGDRAVAARAQRDYAAVLADLGL